MHVDNQFSAAIRNFRIQGQLFHEIGSLNREDPKFAQLCIIENEQALQKRHDMFPDLNEEHLRKIQDMLYAENPFVQIFKTAKELLELMTAKRFV